MKDSTSTIRAWWVFRHPISGFSHLAGMLFSGIGLWVLLARTLNKESTSHLIAALVFGLSMCLLYLSSASYHLLSLSQKATARLRKLDHSMIYMFIAGCYTPVCLLILHERRKWVFLIGVWGFSLAGVLLKMFWQESVRWLRIGIYLTMGWVGILLVPDLVQSLPSGAMQWLVYGGLSYSIGSIIYATKWPDPAPTVFGFHEIWHLFVLLGSFFHFWFMLYVFAVPA
jgi:hemolysin III